jgi:hypothetical protein
MLCGVGVLAASTSHGKALEQMGFPDLKHLRYPPSGEVKMNDLGGVNAIAFEPETSVFTGIGDPRRYGSAMGPRVIPNDQ